jgi:glutaredoxin 3
VKEYLSSRNVRIIERDVTADREAAAEMIRLTQQRGVPVVVIEGQVVVGFNRPQLERLLSTVGRPRLGAAVADAATMAERGLTEQRSGAYVGRVQPGGVADAAGLHQGDVIIRFGGRPVASAVQLQQLLAGLQVHQPVPIDLVREGRTLEVVLAF